MLRKTLDVLTFINHVRRKDRTAQVELVLEDSTGLYGHEAIHPGGEEVQAGARQRDTDVTGEEVKEKLLQL